MFLTFPDIRTALTSERFIGALFSFLSSLVRCLDPPRSNSSCLVVVVLLLLVVVIVVVVDPGCLNAANLPYSVSEMPNEQRLPKRRDLRRRLDGNQGVPHRLLDGALWTEHPL